MHFESRAGKAWRAGVVVAVSYRDFIVRSPAIAWPIRPGPPRMKGMKSRARRTVSYSVFYEQAPDSGYVTFVPALPGCHTQGETLEETERNVKEAIALYLESLASHGEAIPEERRSFQGRVSVPVSIPA
jgi:predicted RNase H-like HicB family nuclease